ncbi:MAG TPA: M56 family metallopeptidase [Steroidobacteraceae bacterium]|nr:M56 family metallopeptidase [Steroidobacteraceae bacterium]
MNVTPQQALTALRHVADPAVRSLIVAGVAAMAVQLLRVKRTSLLLGVWTAVLYAALAMPLLGSLLPALPLHVPVSEGAFASPAETRIRPPRGSAVLRVLTTGDFAAPASPAIRPVPTPRHSSSWPLGTLAAYFLTTCFLLGRLALGMVWGRRLERGAQPIHHPAVRLAVAEQAAALHLERAVRVAQSGAVAVPLTLGVLHPAILLPDNWPTWDSSKLAAVIAHELAHVKRRDALTRTISGIYRCFFWFSPLAWWLHRYLADLAELASDEDAIGAGADRADYAEVLMSFFTAINQGRGRVRSQGISMAQGTRACRRIEQVLSAPPVARVTLRRPLIVLIAAGAIVAVVLIAALKPMLAAASSPRSTRIIANGDGMNFAIVSNHSMSMNGSLGDRDEVQSLQRKLPGDFIWFTHDGSAYVIQDAATLKIARQLYEPVEALSRQQEALARKQQALGNQQEELARKMEAVTVKTPGDIDAQLLTLESAARRLGAASSRQELAELQDQIGHLQSEIGGAQGSAGRAEELLGRQQSELGRQQGQLGRQQGSLGQEEGRRARQASRAMQAILQQALSNGLARRVM